MDLFVTSRNLLVILLDYPKNIYAYVCTYLCILSNIVMRNCNLILHFFCNIGMNMKLTSYSHVQFHINTLVRYVNLTDLVKSKICITKEKLNVRLVPSQNFAGPLRVGPTNCLIWHISIFKTFIHQKSKQII